MGQVLAEYDETFLTCRDLMHSWRILGHFRSAGWGSTKRLLRCERCRMERTDDFDGVVVRHRYDQPEGYRIEDTRVSKADVRKEQLRRAHVFDTEEEMRKHLKGRRLRAVRSA